MTTTRTDRITELADQVRAALLAQRDVIGRCQGEVVIKVIPKPNDRFEIRIQPGWV